jgi:drug/metabolite transporter (DMT)-like permease
MNAIEDRNESSDILLMVVPGAIWGTSFLFIAQAMESVGPFGLTFARILIGFITLSFFSAARKAVPITAWRGIAGLGVLWMAFPLSLFPFAEQHVSSALTGVLNGAVPIFATIVAATLAKSWPARGVLIGLAVGMLGTILVSWSSIHAGSNSTNGVLLILAAVISYGFAINLARPLQQRYGALPVIWRAQFVAILLTTPLGAPSLLKAHWTLTPLLSILALGIFGTAIAFVLATLAAGRLGSAKASATIFLTPVVALFLGVIVRGEQVTLLSILGGAVCLLGAWIIRSVNIKAQQAPLSPR